MGGPSCLVALRRPLPGNAIESFQLLLARIAIVAPYDDTDLLEIRADPEGDNGCIFAGMEEEQSSDAIELCDRVEAAAGWRPVQVVSVFSMNRAPVNHGWLGRVAMEIAQRQDGLVELLTICSSRDDDPGPPPPEVMEELDRCRAALPADDRDLMEVLIPAAMSVPALERWVNRWLEERTRDRIAGAPGVALESRRSDGMMGYLVDATYLGAWLQDPEFFID